jgi:hypothetical protein
MNTSNIVSAQDFPTGTLEGGVARDDIQFMPPGVHSINASRGGKLCKLRMRIHAGTAAVIARAFDDHIARFKAGQGDKPFFDFNHNDDAASGHPLQFYWGGDDLKAGGVRCKTAWNEEGENAIVKQKYTRFSPQFIPDDESGEVIGMPVNMGGLVNRAAFKSIQPVLAKEFLDNPVLATAADLANARGIPLPQAINLVCGNNADYLTYMRSIGLRGPGETAVSARAAAARGVETAADFIASAKAATGKTGIEAFSEFASTRAGNEAYRNYLLRMRGVR